MPLPSPQTSNRWLALYLILMLLGLPSLPYLVRLVREILGPRSFALTLNLLLALPLLFLVRHHFLHSKKTRWWSLAPMLPVLLLLPRLQNPVEKIHFLEYGGLGALLFVRMRPQDLKGWGQALAWVALVGALDEGIQHWLPNRVGDWQDVLLNLVGGLVGLSYASLHAKQPASSS